MKTAFTPFTLDESSAMHIQSVKCKFALTNFTFQVDQIRPSVRAIHTHTHTAKKYTCMSFTS